MIGGVSIASEITLANEAKYFPIFFEAQGKLAVGTGLAEGEIGAAVALLENQYNVPTSSLNHAPLLTKAPGAEGTNVAVELQAKIAAGKVKARGTWMNASPMG
jgi:hypothetical protein